MKGARETEGDKSTRVLPSAGFVRIRTFCELLTDMFVYSIPYICDVISPQSEYKTKKQPLLLTN